jgi:hypothetical protein
MVEIHPGLHVGSENEYESRVRPQAGWAVIHACKDPYHRQALGYTGRAAPKGHPEYLIAYRGDRLILNLVDAADPAYIPDEIMNAAVAFIHERLSIGQKVMVHCNRGMSRSPSIAMLYLAIYTERLSRTSFERDFATFREIYPPFAPAHGVVGYLRARWLSFAGNSI